MTYAILLVLWLYLIAITVFVIYAHKTLVLLEAILKILSAKTLLPAVKIKLLVGGKERTGMLTLRDDKQISYALEADDIKGNAGAVLDSPPVWSVSDAALATVVAAADGMSAVVSPVGPLGSFQVNVAAVAGGVALNAQDQVQIIAGAAVTLKISGTQQDVPSA